jgi:hypothetical protein
MPEELSDEMRSDAAGFVSELPASIVMPAGAGKTHLLAATAKHVVDNDGKVLVLSHTNAGVYAIHTRLRRFGVTNGVQVSTITSFAFRLARAYPTLGDIAVPKVAVPGDSQKYVRAAVKIVTAVHIKAVLAASYTHVLVDEYQDCNADHHALVLGLRNAIPDIGIFGDPLQAIFGFAEPLPDWGDVLGDFPQHETIEAKPHRWGGHNEPLGEWLLNLRDALIPGRTLRLDSADYPPGVTFTDTSSIPNGVTRAALEALSLPTDESILIIAAWARIARDIGSDLNGTYTVMEDIAGEFMADWLAKLVDVDNASYASWLFAFTKCCHCGHGILDPNPLGKRYAAGRVGADLLTTSSKREGAKPAIEALDRVVANPTLNELGAAMDVIPSSPALRLHSHEAWYEVRTAIRGAIARGGDKSVLLEELAKARDVLRHAGRPERSRIVSRTRLIKGLEYDHVVIADAAMHSQVNDLYVALTRARKSIKILSRSDTIALQPSPRGPTKQSPG